MLAVEQPDTTVPLEITFFLFISYNAEAEAAKPKNAIAL